jgi:hypothetical protein
VVCSRVRQLQEALFAGMIALEISSRNARVAALQKRWDRLRSGLDLILDQRGAEMADLPGGASGLLVRDYKGKKADRLVARIAPCRFLYCATPTARSLGPSGSDASRGADPIRSDQRL